MVEMTRQLIGDDLTGRKVTVLGATFKPDSDDIRDAPSLAVARLLHQAGAQVTVHDPKGIPNAERAAPELSYDANLSHALSGAEVVLHLTEWREYRSVNPAELIDLVAKPNIIDGRNVLDLDAWKTAGWNVRAPGRTA